jgi:hypothetical protein
VEKAIVCYLGATEVFTKVAHPGKFADLQMSLCAAHLQRVQGKRRENLENAQRRFDACKEVRAESTLSSDWVKEQWATSAQGGSAGAGARNA